MQPIGGGGGAPGRCTRLSTCGAAAGGEGWAFLFWGLCSGSWDRNAKPSELPSFPATQRLAEGRAADGDLPGPLGWPELAWPLLRGEGRVSSFPLIPVSGAGVAAR